MKKTCCCEVLGFDPWMIHFKDLKDLTGFLSSLKKMDCLQAPVRHWHLVQQALLVVLRAHFKDTRYIVDLHRGKTRTRLPDLHITWLLFTSKSVFLFNSQFAVESHSFSAVLITVLPL